MCQELRYWKRARLMLEQRLQRCPMLRVVQVLQVLAQLHHLVWNPLLQRLARYPDLQAHLAAPRRENQ